MPETTHTFLLAVSFGNPAILTEMGARLYRAPESFCRLNSLRQLGDPLGPVAFRPRITPGVALSGVVRGRFYCHLQVYL